MTHCTVIVAAYQSLSSALRDWDTMEASMRTSDLRLVDAALVEGDTDTIRIFHRHSSNGYGKGAIAGAVVGLLRPPSIVTGAIAGGVGGRVIVALGNSISRDEVKHLGEALDAGPITIVALTAEPPPRAAAWAELLPTADAAAAADSGVSAEEIQRAVDADNADE
jgi:uncharacterized membrane protein